jgi:hypothetical protein
MPNRTPDPRPMIAMIHTSSWLETPRPLVFPVGSESFFDHPVLRTAARFTTDPIDYLAQPQGFEYELAR